MRNEIRVKEEEIERAAFIIRQGGLVAFPTETVYGLGACAFNTTAVAKIFEVKQRPYFDPIIVHIADLENIKDLCLNIDNRAKTLIEKFWPGPLTLVLPRSNKVPDIVTSGLDTVAIRMPSHTIALDLIKRVGLPVAAPSANLFSCLSPTTAEHVREQIGKDIDMIIDGGNCQIGIESTILDLSNEPVVLRPGGISIEEIEKVIGKVKISTFSNTPNSAGQLLHHYSPKTPLKIIRNKNFNINKEIKAGLLSFVSPNSKQPFEIIEILSQSGDLREAAVNLFLSLHKLDKAELDIIYAEPVPEIGLGRAIMDRLYKAEVK